MTVTTMQALDMRSKRPHPGQALEGQWSATWGEAEGTQGGPLGSDASDSQGTDQDEQVWVGEGATTEQWSPTTPRFPLRSLRQRRDQSCKILLFHTFKRAPLQKHQLPRGWRSGEAGRGAQETGDGAHWKEGGPWHFLNLLSFCQCYLLT